MERKRRNSKTKYLITDSEHLVPYIIPLYTSSGGNKKVIFPDDDFHERML